MAPRRASPSFTPGATPSPTISVAWRRQRRPCRRLPVELPAIPHRLLRDPEAWRRPRAGEPDVQGARAALRAQRHRRDRHRRPRPALRHGGRGAAEDEREARHRHLADRGGARVSRDSRPGLPVRAEAGAGRHDRPHAGAGRLCGPFHCPRACHARRRRRAQLYRRHHRHAQGLHPYPGRHGLHGRDHGAVSLGTTKDSTYLCYLPVFWVAGEVFGVIFPIFAGCTCVLLNRWDPVAAMAAIDRYRVTHASFLVDGPWRSSTIRTGPATTSRASSAPAASPS